MKKHPKIFENQEFLEFIEDIAPLNEVMNPLLQKAKLKGRRALLLKRAQDARELLHIKRQNLAAETEAKTNFNGQLVRGLGSAISRLREQDENPYKENKLDARPELDPGDRDRNRKREERRQDEQESILSRVVIVKNNNNGKTMLILNTDFDPKKHTLLLGTAGKENKGPVSMQDIETLAQEPDFMNTKTSEKLIGQIQQEQEQNPEMAQANPAQAQPQAQMQNPAGMIPQAPGGKNKKDPSSSYPDWDHTEADVVGILPDMLNMALGKMQTPMMPEIPSQTLQKAALRIISSITKQEPALQMHTFIAGSQIPANTTDLWFAAGIPSDASYAQMLSSGEDGTNFSFAIKIGPQIKLVSSPVDAKNFITSAFASLDPVYYKDTFGQLLKDLSDSYRNQKQVRAITTTMVRVNPDIPVSINNKQKDTVTPDMELDDFYRIKRNLRKKIQKVFVDLINKSTSLKTNIIHQCLTGKGKFVDPTGFATHMICSSMDGTNAKIIPLNLQYCRTVAKGVNTELNIIFTELPPSETSIIDDIADTGTKKSGQPLSEQKESQSLAQTLEKVFKDLEKDPILLLEAFGLDIENIVYINPINYQDYYFPIISNYNSVTFNPGHADQEEISISVEDDEINRKNDKIESGNELMEAYILMNDYLVDSIKNNKLCLEEALQLLNEEFDLLCERRERNYKKEYREYHGKPEQIKRRAGRVTARRKAIRQGKVRKGDKKDVHHEDGNPKNNSSDNLKIMSRSRNRSIKEEHGAGDIGTDELRKKFVKETPFMIDPIKFVDRFKKKK